MSTGMRISYVEKHLPVLMARADGQYKLARVVGCLVEGVVACQRGFFLLSRVEVKEPRSYDATYDTNCKTDIKAKRGL